MQAAIMGLHAEYRLDLDCQSLIYKEREGEKDLAVLLKLINTLSDVADAIEK